MKVMTVLLFLSLSFSACAQQPSREQVAVWSYLLKQCENEGISRSDRDAMFGCISLKERQSIPQGSQFGNVLQGMGAALNPQVYQGFTAPSGVQQCHTTPDYAGGYRTICQ